MIIYVLKLEDGKFYIGKTKNLDSRIKDHFDGIGCLWTKKYKPLEIVETFEEKDKFDEDITTKKYMMKYGTKNVRGGSYTQIIIPKEIKRMLIKEFCSATDRCYKCKKKGHYANDCDFVKEKKSIDYSIRNNVVCYKCNRRGHYANMCNYKESNDICLLM
jgi:predicted GIY-YIG superfamily endonuclease